MSGLLVDSALHHGDRERRRGGHAALGHRGRAGGRALPSTDELFDAVIWQYGAAPEVAGTTRRSASAAVSSELDSAGYRAMVAGAVSDMQRPEARLRKVVLSRPLTVELRAASR